MSRPRPQPHVAAAQLVPDNATTPFLPCCDYAYVGICCTCLAPPVNQNPVGPTGGDPEQVNENNISV